MREGTSSRQITVRLRRKYYLPLFHLFFRPALHSPTPFTPLVFTLRISYPLFLFEYLFTKLPVQVFSIVVVIDGMIAVGEPCVLHLLWRNLVTHQQVRQGSSVLEMYIVITAAMLDKEASRDILKAG